MFCLLSYHPLLQPIGSSTRYMTLAHRREVIEAMLAMIADDKLDTLVEWLSKRYATMKELIGTYVLIYPVVNQSYICFSIP